MSNREDNLPQNDSPQKREQSIKPKSERNQKRLGILATFLFGVASFFGGFMVGERYPKTQSPQSPPPAIFIVQSQGETRNLSEKLRNILKRAADKLVSVEEAVIQILETLQISISDVELARKIRRIVEIVIETGTDEAVQDGLNSLIDLLKLMAKPSPSPMPTPTIVFPSK
jgi:hypothetical protein